ncbi:hypothetical protein Misp01_22050 [Microtetraspora sp. NBRC 13810]|uniref:hypothetical protein n=1 Tax=Microtetraspora sp. NBRC 13810 TaxID=3030990 RepID=UPI0024A4D1CA|nr:hypothetical protein [Microtetraspora sp. NBRC 13810]GLW07075.1 hypothetical protein Misp01_22050 [Microtetraspora sp. NBRC 13810]
MNEFKLIDDVMPDVPPPSPATIAAARAGLRPGAGGRPRLRGAILAAAATVALIAAVTLVPRLGGDVTAVSPARPPVVTGDVRTDTASPPERVIAAGGYAVSAYWIGRWVPASGDVRELRRTWYLLDPRTATYRETPWRWLDVAPGLRLAAVLEGDLPSRRVGILDLATREVLDWIDLDHPAAGLSWSPDGKKILATAYARHPDVREFTGGDPLMTKDSPSSRTGFTVIDVAERTTRFIALPALSRRTAGRPGNQNARQDLQWSQDGTLIWGPTDTLPDKVFYDLDGRPHATPAEPYVHYAKESTVSPDGRLEVTGPPLGVRDRATGKVVGTPDILQFLAWADNDRMIALGCADRCSSEHRNGLVLVSADGKERIPLSGVRENDEIGRWNWLLTRR